MAVSHFIYANGMHKFASQSLNWDTPATGQIKVALMNTYAPNQTTHEFWGDAGVSSTEIAGVNGYTTGGIDISTAGTTAPTVSGLVVSFDDTTNPSWTASGGSIGPATHAIVYNDTGTPATSALITYVDFGQSETATDGNTFTITWGSAVFTITCA